MFMIFDGNHAVNLDLVTSMSQDDERPVVTINFNTGSSVLVKATIDQILTAQAAGQSRVKASVEHTFPLSERQRQYNEIFDQAAHFDDGSKRESPTGYCGPGETLSGGYDQLASGNDKQAMNSIGRKR